MTPTIYPHINVLLDRLLSRIQAVLDGKLVGLYLDGSLVLGDFDQDASDIDLTAVLTADIDDQEFEALKRMHDDFVSDHPKWHDRIEVCYISRHALNTVKSQQHPIVNISPGEPFHRLTSRREWLLSWYLIRERGITLLGPPPRTIIEPISHDEFIQSVRDHVRSWLEWVAPMRTRGAQAYAILTLCRALYACTCGEQTSKRQAALWAAAALPEWSALILSALAWRQAAAVDEADDRASYQDTVRCVNAVVQRVVSDAEGQPRQQRA
jgi:hypothetical protein